ncbi:hypothetical protein V501_01599 [Pseudogymnoascus sp. VKM F-4519 (FW-2642)]|nr:hypothetical protein V501_01599 [Pseudogymnoascus sp. VKM F-4519 (FW-2642)]
MTPSLKLLSLAILLATISSVLASNDCAASTWSKAGLKIRQVKTSSTSKSTSKSTSTSKSPLSSSSSASLVHSIISSSSRASTNTTSTSSASAATSSTATDIISVGNVTAGQVNCRYSGTTDSDVNYYTCKTAQLEFAMRERAQVTLFRPPMAPVEISLAVVCVLESGPTVAIVDIFTELVVFAVEDVVTELLSRSSSATKQVPL